MPSIDQPRFHDAFRHGLVSADSPLARALDEAGVSAKKADLLDGKRDGIIASDAIDDFYDLVSGLNGRGKVQRSGDEYAIYKAATRSSFPTDAAAAEARDRMVSAQLSGPAISQTIDFDDAPVEVRGIIDMARTDPRGAAEYLSFLAEEDPALYRREMSKIGDKMFRGHISGAESHFLREIRRSRSKGAVKVGADMAEFLTTRSSKLRSSTRAHTNWVRREYADEVAALLGDRQIADFMISDTSSKGRQAQFTRLFNELTAAHPELGARVAQRLVSSFAHATNDAFEAGDVASADRHARRVGWTIKLAEDALSEVGGSEGTGAMGYLVNRFIDTATDLIPGGKTALTLAKGVRDTVEDLADWGVEKALDDIENSGWDPEKAAEQFADRMMMIADDIYAASNDPSGSIRRRELGDRRTDYNRGLARFQSSIRGGYSGDIEPNIKAAH